MRKALICSSLLALILAAACATRSREPRLPPDGTDPALADRIAAGWKDVDGPRAPTPPELRSPRSDETRARGERKLLTPMKSSFRVDGIHGKLEGYRVWWGDGPPFDEPPHITFFQPNQMTHRTHFLGGGTYTTFYHDSYIEIHLEGLTSGRYYTLECCVYGRTNSGSWDIHGTIEAVRTAANGKLLLEWHQPSGTDEAWFRLRPDIPEPSNKGDALKPDSYRFMWAELLD